MKQPKNSLIAIMIGLNILLTVIIVLQTSNIELEQVANAMDSDEAIQMIEKDNKQQKIKEADVLYSINSVTSSDSELPTMPLYYSHENVEGAFFKYLATDINSEYVGGYWFVDWNTLHNANIYKLQYNQEIQGIFYDGDYFEIKEVQIAQSN